MYQAECGLLDSLSLTFREARDSDSKSIQKLILKILEEFGLEADLNEINGNLPVIDSNYQKNDRVLWVIERADSEIVATTAMLSIDSNDERNYSKKTISGEPQFTQNLLTKGQSVKIMELRKMYITSEYRNKGLGRFLLQKNINWCKQNKVIKIRLKTASVLKSAIALYTKFGFQEIPAATSGSRCDRQFELQITG